MVCRLVALSLAFEMWVSYLTELQTSTNANSMDSDETVTLQLTDRLSVRLYRDCRPSCLETGALQKGLVLLLDGRELIEEGVGFGVPIVKYEDKTFFSSTADVSIQKTGSSYTLTKVFTLDTVSLKKFGRATYIDDELIFTPEKNLPKPIPQTQKTQPSLQQSNGASRLSEYKN